MIDILKDSSLEKDVSLAEKDYNKYSLSGRSQNVVRSPDVALKRCDVTRKGYNVETRPR